MKRKFKYIKVKDGVISLLETDDFNEVIKDTYGGYYAYDSTDYFFEEDLDIRVFVKEAAMYLNLEKTIVYEYDNEVQDILYGTVLIAKNGLNKWHSLSNRDIKIIYKKLEPYKDNYYLIRYPKEINYIQDYYNQNNN